jgi:hypothetical protein
MCPEHVHACQRESQHDNCPCGHRQKEPRNRCLLIRHGDRLEGSSNFRGRELKRVDMSRRSAGTYEVGLFGPMRRRCRSLRSVGSRMPPGFRRHQRLGREVLNHDRPRCRTRCFRWIRSRRWIDRVRQGSGEGWPIQHIGIVCSCRGSTRPSRSSTNPIRGAMLWYRGRGSATCGTRCSACRGCNAVRGVGFGCNGSGTSRRGSRGRC